MSYCLLDKTISLDNLKIDSDYKLDDGSYRRFLYITNSSEKLCGLLIKTSRLRLIYNLNLNNYNSTKLPLYPYFSETKDFVKTIKSIERRIKKRFKDCGEFVSILNLKKDNLKTIKLNFKKDIKFKSVLGELDVKQLKQDGQLKLLLKIPYIWFRNDKFGISLIVEQGKYYPSPFDLEVDFWSDDEDEPNYIIKKSKVTRIDQCSNCSSMSYHLHTKIDESRRKVVDIPVPRKETRSIPPPLPNNKPPVKKTTKSSSGSSGGGGFFFSISKDQILKAKSSLRSIKKPDKN